MKKWKEASSLIITGALQVKNTLKSDNLYMINSLEKSNFFLLALKKKSESFPKACVFPGGAVSQADSFIGWIKLFEDFNVQLESYAHSVPNSSCLPIFKSNVANEIPRWLSLKITAIRETFEECGLLLCKQKNNIKHESFAQHFQINSPDLWRRKVMQDPHQFYNLCREFQCYPNISVLHPWSNWLTPSHISKRFDAMFFITVLNKIENFTPDNMEIESVEWCSPEELLHTSRIGDIWFLPPQFYEINRLKTISTLEDLMKYLSIRIKAEYIRWMPVYLITRDGCIALLPGDQMYPETTDLFTSECIEKNNVLTKDVRCSKMHRIEQKGLQLELVIRNMKGDKNIPEWTHSNL